MTLDEPVALRGFQYKHGDRPLDGFTIERAAGRGGFGEVYYAVSDSGREVALKLIHTYEQIELRGISQCMNLKSPQLVTIFDVKYGEDGRPWVIMEYVAGPSLRELLDAAPAGLGTTKAAFFLREIGKGLTYLHECGIVHRDLKPGNIFYENGCVKIGDYGLSKSMSVTRNSGQTVAVGTMHYMAPEIGEGCYDRSIDIYALGALLFEMLTGQVPFLGASPAEVLMKHLSSDVDADAVEEPFKSVIRKAMAKNPAERFASVQEMVEAVFGSEHVRNSVTQFAPQSLTMVAGRVARDIGSGPPPQGAGARPRTDERWGPKIAKLEHKAARMRGRLERVRERIANRWVRRGQRPTRPSDPRDQLGARPVRPDAIPLHARLLLMFVACGLTGFIAMAATPAFHRDRDQGAMFVFLSVLGAAIGVKIAWRVMSPAVLEESGWFKRFVLGVPAALGAAVYTFPAWLDGSFHFGHRFQQTGIASFATLVLLKWEDRLAPYRKERLSIGHLFSSGFAALIIAGFFEGEPLLVILVVTGASLAVSLWSAWGVASVRPDTPFPQVAMPRPIAPPPLPANRVEPPAAPTNEPSSQTTQGPQRGPMMSALSAIAPYASLKPARSLGHFAASLARTVISMVGSITFLASLALALAIVTDVPGMFASGIVKHPSPFEFEQALGTPQWPRLLVDLGAAACIVTAMISLTMLLFVRRGGGGPHILRGLFGALTLFSAVFALGQALPGWADIAPGPTPADTLDAYLRHAQLSHVLWAAGVFLIGMVVLFWPASRRVRMIGTPKTPTLPHAPGGATAATGTAGQKVG